MLTTVGNDVLVVMDDAQSALCVGFFSTTSQQQQQHADELVDMLQAIQAATIKCIMLSLSPPGKAGRKNELALCTNGAT